MILEALVLLVSLAAFLCFRLRHKQSTYWQKLGVKSPPLTFPFGNQTNIHADVILSRRNALDVAKEQYKLMAGEKVYGTFMIAEPSLVIVDPDLIKQILVKDFNHFSDRRGVNGNKMFGGNSRTDHIWRNQLVFSSGEAWKDMRSTFTPIFTSGKMKAMVNLIMEVNTRLMGSFEEEAIKGKELNLKEKFGKFSMDTIASCAFGMDAQSFSNPNSAFLKNAKGIFSRSLQDIAKITFVFLPGGLSIMNLLRIAVFKPKQIAFFDEVIQNTLRERQNSKTKRNDLIDMMLEAMKDDSKDDADVEDADAKLSHRANKKDLDEISIIATALIILVAGYDTTSQTLSYAAYELAKNEDIQRRLQDEIDQVMEDTNGKAPDYATIQSMEYLDMVLHETLRLYPAIGSLERAATKDYVIPGTNIKISKGQELLINVAGLHSDPKHYPEPERFNPEHFSKEGKAARHPYVFLGFGQGPRSCIGMRFALLGAKIALISLFGKYNVVRTVNTVERVTLDPSAPMGAPGQALIVKLVPRS